MSDPCQCNPHTWPEIPRGQWAWTNQRSWQQTAIWPQMPLLTAEHLSFLPAAKWQIKEAAGEELNTPDAALLRLLFSFHVLPPSLNHSSTAAPLFLPSHFVTRRHNIVSTEATTRLLPTCIKAKQHARWYLAPSYIFSQILVQQHAVLNISVVYISE